MAIGQAYEAIKYGKQTVIIAGGAEELSAAGSAVFDVLLATSVQNDRPETTPRPFDAKRDGLVVAPRACACSYSSKIKQPARCWKVKGIC
jgi:3-oxoacyl-[acyl-carrier-protein] synthase II